MQPEVAFVPTNQLRHVGWSETDLLQTNQLCRIVRAASRPTYDVAGMHLLLLTKQLFQLVGHTSFASRPTNSTVSCLWTQIPAATEVLQGHMLPARSYSWEREILDNS